MIMAPPGWLGALCLLVVVAAEHARDLEVSEGAPVGTRIGYIGDEAASTDISAPPYLIVPSPGSAVDSDLAIDHTTGEIRTKVPLDRETRSSYSLVAIPFKGENVRVMVRVLDENDNAPTFPAPSMSIEFPENTPRDVKRTLYPARDLDLGIYNTQRYNIISGNVNNAFRLSSHRERDGVLYLDLQINGFLDRETTSGYSLVIEALDGGSPPLRGQMTVNITIQDVNDNQPIFNQSRYFASVPENATVGTSVLHVFAVDNDAGENGEVEYAINRRQSDRDNMFRIDPRTGLISVNKPLDFETKELHELVIVAKDHGLQPLETTAFVSISVTDVNDNQPIINVIFLSDDATPKISESAQPGEFVARISVNDPDSKTEYSNVNVTLSGGDGRFGLTTRDNIIYLVIVSLPLDREIQPNYTLSVVATDTGTPPLHASKTIHLRVTDVNDNAPEFDREVYYADVMEVSDPGTSVVQVFATDRDEGNNSAITYSLWSTPEAYSGWFRVDARSGLVTTRSHVDCETDPSPKLVVAATDNGFPPLSSTATIVVTIHDVNDNEPIFVQSFYNVSVAENEARGRCILKVSATDPDCGINAVVNYTLGDDSAKTRLFQVRSNTGEICLADSLDYETRNSYEFPVVATDRGGLSTTAMVKIQVTDVNDNRPVFYPRQYNVSLREGSSSSLASSPLVVVAASDKDSGRYGAVYYRISSGNEDGLFRIDRNSGEIFVNRPSLLSSRSQPYHRLNISASDGGGLKSSIDAEVFISIIDSTQKPPIFEMARYSFAVKENTRKDTVVGTVRATTADIGYQSSVRYSIYSGDPDGLFSIDPVTGVIRAAAVLDHESRASVLLNVQATSGDPPVYGHAQVNIDIEDLNDNAPEFESSIVRISVPENVDLGTALYVANAIDRDSGINGLVRYRINAAASSGLFAIDSRNGHVTLARPLDYETAQRHSFVITATDAGKPAVAANLTVHLEVQDVNDNTPVFEQREYSIQVLESLPVKTQVLQVTAVDLDTGNNARITYRLSKSYESANTDFGIFPNNGWIYIKTPLNREKIDHYLLTITATDNGTPSRSASARVHVQVLDANDNEPKFQRSSYAFAVEENLQRGASVGAVLATDADLDANAAVRYSLIPTNTSFQINSITGEIVTRNELDRELKSQYDLIVEARDQGSPPRSSRAAVKVLILDVNDNPPEIVDPQEDVISVREGQPAGTEVAKIRAVDADDGNNSTITYLILKGRESDGSGVFTIDPMTGVVRTKTPLDHEENAIYRLEIGASDNGKPPRQTVRLFRVEVLDINDNRPTFTSSSLTFKVQENVSIGHKIGSIATSSSHTDKQNIPTENSFGHVTYTLSSLMQDSVQNAFDIDRSSGDLVVLRQLDREQQPEYRLEVRALDTSALNNPQSSAVMVKIELMDVNDNAPIWPQDPVSLSVPEDVPVGQTIHNFTAVDLDHGPNGEVRYRICSRQQEAIPFSIDPLTGSLIVANQLDYEAIPRYTLVVCATDQALNTSERHSTAVTVIIELVDVNDNFPRFVNPSNTIMVSESAGIGKTLARISAVDSDSKDNGRVSYSIVTGNEEGKFSLGHTTGILVLVKPLNAYEKTYSSELYTILNVTARDHGSPSKESYLVIKVLVQDSLEFRPEFSKSVYRVKVSEDSPVGKTLITVGLKAFLSEDRNITYFIPNGIGQELFQIHPKEGSITLKGPLDRETKDEYAIPVYVVAESGPGDALSNGPISNFDVALIIIQVLDVNDNAPSFNPDSCSVIYIPENSDFAVIHTVVAYDPDIGSNGDLSYNIAGGNFGNKFSIDMHTGELSARPLDRETQGRYLLTISAQDRGSPAAAQETCNVSIIVEDQNDNDPRFDSPQYMASIPENVAVDTSVIRVHATDADLGENSKIIYSLANESQWMFRIDNKTGVITTAGLFDREDQDVFYFLVVATDGGKYDARSQKVPVKISITDVNDNKPLFTKYPFKEKLPSYIQPGQRLLKVEAEDLDEFTNSEIVYSLLNETYHTKFRLNPKSGVLTATQSLASEVGKVLYLNIEVRDKGNPPQSSIGLIELTIGDLSESVPKLQFQNASYVVNLPENSPKHQSVLQVSAFRSDGRKQNIIYSFGMGNEGDAFAIDPHSGLITVRSPQSLDFERSAIHSLVVEAKAEGSMVVRGFCTVEVRLVDQNDNAPIFTQQEYLSSVWEGNNKGTYVMQVKALDRDHERNSKVLYHIVDGNHDTAFVIEPAFSGIVKTNIVLDREIRDTYRLTVIATDEGVPQLTGTARIRINIVDVNDNQPTFPPHSVISVSEAMPIGTVLTTVKANDVDTNPSLTYTFSDQTDNVSLETFTIDRYSGRIILHKQLDFEFIQEYTLIIVASDTAHSAQTTLVVRITDYNDNAPVFDQPHYIASIPELVPSVVNMKVLAVNATDADSGNNSVVRYSLHKPMAGFSISETSGILYVNQTVLSYIPEDVQLDVVATDGGIPAMKTFVPVRIRNLVRRGSQYSVPNKKLTINVKEDLREGSVVAEIVPGELKAYQQFSYSIISGNDDEVFEIINNFGIIVLAKPLDREKRDAYALVLALDDDRSYKAYLNETTILVNLHVEDCNDNPPKFKADEQNLTLSEGTPIGRNVGRVMATDADLLGTANSEVEYEITSGNDLGYFRLDETSGALSVNQSLDYDSGNSEFNLVVRACDRAELPLCAFSTLKINLLDENDNSPQFPVEKYVEFIGENEPVGTSVFTARASDLDKGLYGHLNYSISSTLGFDHSYADDSWKMFKVDAESGVVTSSAVFDYERRHRYSFVLVASDKGGNAARVQVQIEVESRDEYHPQFTERTYRFVLPEKTAPAGYVVGHVLATDRDKGVDGRIVYQLTAQNAHFKVNRTTGAVVLKKRLQELGKDVSLVVSASSGRQGSLTNMTVVEVAFSRSNEIGANLAISGRNGTSSSAVAHASEGLANWALGLLVVLVLILLCLGLLFIFVHMRNRRNKSVNKPNLRPTTSNSYVDPSVFDTIPVRNAAHLAATGGQFAPPKYDEIPPYGQGHAAGSNSGAATTSELSGSEQSGSSGRGSAEDVDDGEDEEIRMINEGISAGKRVNALSRQGDEDNLSDVSVRNTQEYLARLGIINSGGSSSGAGPQQQQQQPQPQQMVPGDCMLGKKKKDPSCRQEIPLDGLAMFDEDGRENGHIPSLIYAKLNDVVDGASSNASTSTRSSSDGKKKLPSSEDVISLGNYAEAVASAPAMAHHHPSMNGSLSSIVHSEEELTGSYNWDYLLDWGPQYQPLAHVFSEIARLKEDSASVKSNSSRGSIVQQAKGAAPRQIIACAPPPSSHLAARSPIGHDAASKAMSPSFSPSLSPLATKPLSVSPMMSVVHHVGPLQRQAVVPARAKPVIDTELRI